MFNKGNLKATRAIIFDKTLTQHSQHSTRIIKEAGFKNGYNSIYEVKDAIQVSMRYQNNICFITLKESLCLLS